MSAQRRRRPFTTVASFAALLWAVAASSGPARAAATDIASSPLVTSAPSAVLPNLMFVLDDSGSMGYDHLPDWVVTETLCRSTGATAASSGSFVAASGAGCGAHPTFMSSDINGVYYNPAITYLPPVTSAGASYASMTSANTAAWTTVKNDYYGVQDAGSTNLVSAFPDIEWCTSNSYTDCLRNGNYVLPGTVNGKTYTTRRTTTASGSGLMAVGSPEAATTQARAWGPHHYTITPAEYCDSPSLRNCQTAQTAAFAVAAPLRWCNSIANATAFAPAVGTCQATTTATYNVPRFPTRILAAPIAGSAAVAELPAAASFSLSFSKSTCTVNVTALTANGVNLLGSHTATGASASALASSLIGFVNSGGSSYVASSPGAGQVKITAPAGAGAITYPLTFTASATPNNCNLSTSPSAPKFGGYAAAVAAVAASSVNYPGAFTRVDIVPGTASYPRAAARSDCAGAACSYAEEMTNFANWWTYYHTRMQMMKTSASLAFQPVSNQYRVGYLSINDNTGADFLNTAPFESGAKADWFSKLTHANPGNNTPLRTALSTVGRMYAGKLNGNTMNGSKVVDPVQYSCQQNFTILSTDGYWNEAATPYQVNGSTAIGDQDTQLPRPMFDGNSQSNTLADVAAYYYATDLRNLLAFNNCISGSSGSDVCADNVPTGGQDLARHQHMTTFTLGLGASGYMLFDPAYLGAASGDFFDVKNGSLANPGNNICGWQTAGTTCNWPIPLNNSQTAIDDLWHAAVNGRGSYFSAGNPAALYSGLNSMLTAIKSQTGAAAAATTSNPNVTASDNFAYVSTFLSQAWTGELLGQRVDTNTGEIVSAATDWSARTLLDSNASRLIYTFDASAGNHLKVFSWDQLSVGEQAGFQTSTIASGAQALSQFCAVGATCLSAASQTAASGKPLVDYLRGDRGNEGDLSNPAKYFRRRLNLLGDIVNSESVYVKGVDFHAADAGYAAHQTAQAGRQAMVYVGANDGMLHAFNAGSGVEAWAYIPSMLLPSLYKLADKDYANRHQNYVDASPTPGDVQFSDGSWHTVLIGGLGGGGRGYYALDVTDPAAPKALWEFSDTNLGLTFGRVEITKLKDHRWVAIFGSGYNNVSPGDGVGRLYVIDAETGAVVRTLVTGTGSAASPAGLAKVRAWVDNLDVDNTTTAVYGGDNLGNVWRFDVNGDVGAAGYDAQLLATLRGPAGNAQPVTARPELGLVAGKPVVYVGTGRYLGVSDLADASVQSIYAIKDNLGASGFGNPRTSAGFVQQTLTSSSCPTGAASTAVCSAGQTVRKGTSNAVDLATDSGWFVDLPASLERANTDPQLVLGTLFVTTNIVNPSACEIGGSSFINYFDYRTGAPVSSASDVVSTSLGSALATRPTVIGLPNGRVVSLTRMSNGSTVVSPAPIGNGASSTRRVSWRELVTEQ